MHTTPATTATVSDLIFRVSVFFFVVVIIVVSNNVFFCVYIQDLVCSRRELQELQDEFLGLLQNSAEARVQVKPSATVRSSNFLLYEMHAILNP